MYFSCALSLYCNCMSIDNNNRYFKVISPKILIYNPINIYLYNFLFDFYVYFIFSLSIWVLVTSKKCSFWGAKTSKFSSSIYIQFLLTQSSYCLFNSQSKYFCKVFFLDKSFWHKNLTMSYLHLPSSLTTVVDGSQNQFSTTTLMLHYTTSSAVSDERSLFTTSILLSSFFISSTSTIFPSTLWLERELSDFTGINFLGALDTRRLLLDYFEEKRIWQTHVSNDKNYNSSLYDIGLFC